MPTTDVDGFECKLDDGPFENCVSPKLYSPLSIGDHEFQVRAFIIVGEGGERAYDPTPATWNWEVLQIVVDTTIDSATDGNTNPVNDGDATDSNDINFTFSGNVTPAETEVQSQGFECSLDFNGSVPCNGDLNDFTSSQRYDNLSIGFHFFRVSAFVFVNDQKIVDLNPPDFTFYVVPNTVINTAVDGDEEDVPDNGTTTSPTIEFSFSALDNGMPTTDVDGFECKLDDGPFENCVSPKLYSPLSIGDHEFQVRAFIIVGEGGEKHTIQLLQLGTGKLKRIVSKQLLNLQ